MTEIAIQHNVLIANDATAPVCGSGINSFCLEIGHSASYEETARLMKYMETGEVLVGSIHDVEGSSLWNKQVQDVDIVQFAIGDMDEARDSASEIQECMKFDRCFCSAKYCPREHRKTEVDDCGIQGVSGVGQIDSKTFLGVQLSCLRNQSLGKIGVDAPVAGLVGVGQSRTGYGRSDSHMVKLGSLSRQTCLDVAETLPIGQLGKRHYPKLVGTTKRTNSIVSSVPIDDAMKSAPWKKIHNLCKKGLAGIHWHLRKLQFRKDCQDAGLYSSRHHNVFVKNYLYSYCYEG